MIQSLFFFDLHELRAAARTWSDEELLAAASRFEREGRADALAAVEDEERARWEVEKWTNMED